MPIADLLVPVRCAACRAACGEDLCERCADGLRPLVPPFCPRCGAPGRTAGRDGRCGECANHAWFASARSLLVYRPPASTLTLALKRRGRSALAREAGRLLGALAAASGVRPALVTWVPAGRGRAAKGFDHAELLARPAASTLGVPAARLLRRANAPRQSQAGRDDRLRNAGRLFHASGRAAGTVLLVDDVYTTGASADACAAALLEAGAGSVHVVTFARSVRRDRAFGRSRAADILGP